MVKITLSLILTLSLLIIDKSQPLDTNSSHQYDQN